MGDLRWYKRNVDAALVGMAMLTLEERGAYNTVLDLIYSREGNLPDDERSLARLIGCDVRVWRRIRLRLIELGKLYVHTGKLRNGRSDHELQSVQTRLKARRARICAALQHPPNLGAQVKKFPNDYNVKFHYNKRKKDKKVRLVLVEGGPVD